MAYAIVREGNNKVSIVCLQYDKEKIMCKKKLTSQISFVLSTFLWIKKYFYDPKLEI